MRKEIGNRKERKEKIDTEKNLERGKKGMRKEKRNGKRK